jgi:RNase P subunit RPR2
MTSPELSARLRYLNDSAHFLANTSASTSRYLISQRNTLMFDSEIELPDSHRQRTCGACGTILIIGWQTTAQVQTQRARRQKGSNKTARPIRSKHMVYTCESCSRTTRITMPPPVGRHATKPTSKPLKATAETSTPLKPTSTAVTTLTTVNSSSKQRAKARKKGGLEAILANKKANEARNSGFDFSFSDFLKKP